ncbi:MAG TPA: molybdopterin-binding protein [Planctomycetota bacterium]|nr:molybdopterin-binding protein [Planctomycetota bacterium]HRR78589.1 molybdopterin-binding protein [Planctomycetota bacterium]
MRIEAICVSESKGVPKRAIERALFVAGHGIQGDAHAGAWHRQVSLLAAEEADAWRRQLPDLQPGAFAENVLIAGLDTDRLGLGSRLRLGAEAELEVTQLGKECHGHRCTVFERMGDCLMPRRGLFARVTRGGAAQVGDPVEILQTVPRDVIQAVVLTVSDRCSRGEATDTAGPAVAKLLCARLGCHVYRLEIIPDDRPRIEERLRHYSDGHSIDLVVAVGGTGFAPRDVTPEATRAVVDRPTPGLDEAMRAASLAKTPHAALSRGFSGIRKKTLLVNLPGSERAAVENLEAILAALPHGLAKLRGDPSDCGRPPKA